jgi:hypothetical protein
MSRLPITSMSSTPPSGPVSKSSASIPSMSSSLFPSNSNTPTTNPSQSSPSALTSALFANPNTGINHNALQQQQQQQQSRPIHIGSRPTLPPSSSRPASAASQLGMAASCPTFTWVPPPPPSTRPRIPSIEPPPMKLPPSPPVFAPIHTQYSSSLPVYSESFLHSPNSIFASSASPPASSLFAQLSSLNSHSTPSSQLFGEHANNSFTSPHGTNSNAQRNVLEGVDEEIDEIDDELQFNISLDEDGQDDRGDASM